MEEIDGNNLMVPISRGGHSDDNYQDSAIFMATFFSEILRGFARNLWGTMTAASFIDVLRLLIRRLTPTTACGSPSPPTHLSRFCASEGRKHETRAATAFMGKARDPKSPPFWPKGVIGESPGNKFKKKRKCCVIPALEGEASMRPK